jgi:CSLREA domain-containing protein
MGHLAWRGALAALALGAVLVLPGSALGTVAFTVDTTVDSIDASPGDGICADAGGACSLRAAIQEADSDSGQIRILLPAGMYATALANPNPPFGVIPSIAFDPSTGDLDIAGSVSVVGAGAGQTIVDAASLDRVFQIAAGANVTLEGLTIEHGASFDCAGGMGIYNAGALDLEQDDVTNDTGSCGIGGGGVYNSGQLIANGTSIDEDGAFGGGGLYNLGSAVLNASTISGNHGDFGGGGGIDNHGTLALTNVTLAGNAANSANGGALLASAGSAVLRSVTIVSNAAGGSGHGGGIRFAGGTVTLQDTLLAYNGTNCAGGTPTSLGHDLEDRTDCALGATGDISSVDPLASALADNGGPVETVDLSAGSRAIDAGALCPATDARGVVRPQGGGCDIGAFELAAAPSATASTVTASPAGVAADGSSSSTVTVTLEDSGHNAVGGKAVTLSAAAGGSTITTLSGTTSAGGVATFAVTDTTAETVVYTARDTTDAVTLAQTATVAFVAAAAPAAPALVIVANPPAQPPQVTIVSSPGSLTTRTTALFAGSAVDPAGDAIAAWAWDFGDGATASGADTAHVYAAAGTYVVTLRVTDTAGVAGAATHAVVVVTAPDVPPAAVIRVARSGLVVRFDASPSHDPDDAIVRYDWQLGDRTDSRGERVTHRYQRAGTYTVWLTVTDDSGSSGSAHVRIAVRPAVASVEVNEAVSVGDHSAAGSILVGETVSVAGEPTVKTLPKRRGGP